MITSSSIEFPGIPWILECANFVDTSSSMEFHGTWRALISLTRSVQWNSMEFHGTWSAPISMARAVPWNSMELEVCQFRWHEQFHGIPWNLRCTNFDDPSSSMEFYGTWSAPISMDISFVHGAWQFISIDYSWWKVVSKVRSQQSLSRQWYQVCTRW